MSLQGQLTGRLHEQRAARLPAAMRAHLQRAHRPAAGVNGSNGKAHGGPLAVRMAQDAHVPG